jgi:hypothetical protein
MTVCQNGTEGKIDDFALTNDDGFHTGTDGINAIADTGGII